MAAFSIRAKGLGKSYQLSNEKPLNRSLREDLVGFFKGSFLKKAPVSPVFWALSDIDLEIKPGEVVGIVGPNGSGKSTLLKLFSRISDPTKGQIELHGRIGALLEVGTGFHFELTGRENIFLSGAILGMTRREVVKHFDEIVEFSEVSSFLDIPLKRYSSGMCVRLAFSVMAHLRTEIVIVDEVLAVGDSAFQKKCLGKMENVAHQGKTVLYVSHQLETIASLCTRTLFLKNGKLVQDGKPREIIDLYYQSLKSQKPSFLKENPLRRGKGGFRFTDFWIEDPKGSRTEILYSGQDYRFIIAYEIAAQENLKNTEIGIQIATTGNFPITTLSFQEENPNFEFKRGSVGQLICTVKKIPLNSGHFQCHLMARVGGIYGEIEDFIPQAKTFSVEPGPYYGADRIVSKEVFVLLDQSWHLYPSEFKIGL